MPDVVVSGYPVVDGDASRVRANVTVGARVALTAHEIFGQDFERDSVLAGVPKCISPVGVPALAERGNDLVTIGRKIGAFLVNGEVGGNLKLLRRFARYSAIIEGLFLKRAYQFLVPGVIASMLSPWSKLYSRAFAGWGIKQRITLRASPFRAWNRAHSPHVSEEENHEADAQKEGVDHLEGADHGLKK